MPEALSIVIISTVKCHMLQIAHDVAVASIMVTDDAAMASNDVYISQSIKINALIKRLQYNTWNN